MEPSCGLRRYSLLLLIESLRIDRPGVDREHSASDYLSNSQEAANRGFAKPVE